MKKLLVFLAAAVIGLVSCAKDEPVAKVLYQDSATIGGVLYELKITNQGEEYHWENINKTDEVSLTYVFNYERKSDLQKDFAGIAEGLAGIDGSLFPVFTQELRFTNDIDNTALINREVEGGDVLVRFTVGGKTFKLPYRFVVGANGIINEKK